MPISSAACMFQPGSVKVGGTWQVAHWALFSNTTLPCSAALWSKLSTGGFGAEIAAVVADEAFLDLDAPVARVTMPDIPSPHHPTLLEHVLPSVAGIRAEIDRLVGF